MKFRIFLATHGNCKAINNDYLSTIQTGCLLPEHEHYKSMLSDGVGDNISLKNPKFNELTAQYWVWKNYDLATDNADYVGFMHYRRHFLFNENYVANPFKGEWLPNSKVHILDGIPCDYIENNLSRNIIENTISDSDCVLIKKYDVKNLKEDSLRENYSHINQQKAYVFDLMTETVVSLFPEYKQVVEELRTDSKIYMFNMYVMKKKIFFDYCDFLFPVLFSLEKQVDCTHLSEQGMRFIGYMGELISTIFINKHQSELKIKELDGIFINEYPIAFDEIFPAFKDNFTTICVCMSNEYAPVSSIWLQSLLDTISDAHNYDLLVLHKSVSDEFQKMLKSMVVSKNVSLRFINLSSELKSILQDKEIKVPKSHYSIESVFRVISPRFLKNYKRIIYTDLDLIFKDDIQKLDLVNLDDFPIAAAIDPMINAQIVSEMGDWKDYVKNTLKLNDIYTYFNSGVMIVDIEKYVKSNIDKKSIEILCDKDLRTLEQDAFNLLLKDNIKRLDLSWNLLTLQSHLKANKFIQSMDQDTRSEYLNSRKDPKIIHFAGPFKPWFCPSEDYANVWWSIARTSVFYEILIDSLFSVKKFEFQQFCSQKASELSILKRKKRKAIRKMKTYKLLNFIFLGTYKKFRDKKEKYKRIAKDVSLSLLNR